MKRLFILAGLTMTALLLAGCHREADFSDSQGGKMEILLNWGESRTVNDNFSTHWVNGDALNVFYAPAGTTSYSQNTPFTIVDAEKGRATGNVELSEDYYDWYLLYPYTAGIESPIGIVEPLTIGGLNQIQTGNSDMSHLAGKHMPVWGVSKGVPASNIPTVTMRQMNSVLAVNLTNGMEGDITVKRVTVTTPTDIVGSYCVDIQYEGGQNPDFTIADISLVSSSVSLTVQDGAPIGKGKDAKFYLATRPFTLNPGCELSLTVEVEMKGETYTDTKEITLYDTVDFKSGHIKQLNFTFDQRDKRVREILMAFYNALDGPSWIYRDRWGTDAPWTSWEGVDFEPLTGKINLYFNQNGLKGEIPESFGDLGDLLYGLNIYNESGLTGSLPASFAKLTSLEYLTIASTSMTALPDVFADMKSMRKFQVINNEEMSGPIPTSIDSPVLEHITITSSCLTGELQAAWARPGVGHFAFFNNCLTGKIPQAFLDLEDAEVGIWDLLWQKEGYGLDISDIEIHGQTCWPAGEIEDLDGNRFSFEDVIGKNKYTVYLTWAPWCPFSKELMPQLKDYYDLYRQDGLEVIATVMLTETGGIWQDNAAQKEEILAKGYDKWYNFSWWDVAQGGSYLPFVPAAEVYDSDGYIVFSSFSEFPDPERDRFGKTASTDLIPFLETLFGPAEAPDPYESTDYSKDGEVMTLQTATVGKGINIVFMGDGYTDKDMGSGGLYETVMTQAMEEFFAIEPYKTFRNRFNVYAVKVVSKNGRVGDGYTTALSSYFGSGTSMGGNDPLCYEYALKVPGISDKNNLLVGVLVNARRHGGVADLYEATQSAVAYISTYGNDRELFGPTIRHEAGGHGFAFLADEYAQYSGTAPAAHIANYNEFYEKYGWYANVDFTDDSSKIRWSAFLKDARYKGEVGIYEGAALYEKGAYRPSLNGMMNQNFEYHNAPSRWAIYQQIMKRSGEDYSFEKFLEYDAVNRSAGSNAPARTQSKAMPFEHTSPPVVFPK